MGEIRTSHIDRAVDDERTERLCYVVLQHVHTLTRDAPSALTADVIAGDLALSSDEIRGLLAMLTAQGFVDWNGAGGAALITADGANYMLRVADRRRSVRFTSIARPDERSGRGERTSDAPGLRTLRG